MDWALLLEWGNCWVWTRQQCEALGLPLKLSEEYAKSIAEIFSDVQVKHSDALSRTLTADEVNESFEKFTTAVRTFVERIKKASKS